MRTMPESPARSPDLWPIQTDADLAALSDAELIDAMAEWRRLASRAQAAELAAVAELARRRESASSLDAQFATAEIGLALTLSARSADAHVELARALAERLPLTRQALARGDIDILKARVIAQGTRAVDDEVACAVERRTLSGASNLTPGRLRARVERAVIALDPAGAEERRKASEADRHVDCYDTGNGTAVLGGVHLPAGPAIAADNRLCAIAKALKADGDPRTLAQLSADVFLSLLLGTHPASGLAKAAPDAERQAEARAPGRSTTGTDISGATPNAAALVRAVGERIGTVHVTVPLLTLLGLSDEPGEATGYGPLTAEIVRQMAAAASSPATRWCVTVTGAEGGPVHHGHPTYRPPPAMAHLVRSLQPSCRFPGCTRPARACDLDHRVPYDQGGPTCPCNLQPLCRRHHRAKQATGWGVDETDGRIAWTTPAGKTYALEPDRSLPSSVRALPPRGSPVETSWHRRFLDVVHRDHRGMPHQEQRR